MAQTLKINYKDKQSILGNLRAHSKKSIATVTATIPGEQYKVRADKVNKELTAYKTQLLCGLKEQAAQENWTAEALLSSVLLLTYCNYVVMLESRNKVWPYEYMAFSRRIGELWEPFCLLCWEFPVNPNIARTLPPTFKEVKANLVQDLGDFIDEIGLDQEQKEKLHSFYQLVWSLVVSGEIQLKSDLHFKDEQKEYVVDFKSGFSSNEKGNTNRLLMVASIYKALGGYDCLLFVRSKEELNNHYLQTLKNSGLWKVYCGDETYKQIAAFTQFDLLGWIKANVNWQEDFSQDMYKHVVDNNLVGYLEW